MEESKTQDGTIKIKETIPLNTWFFPIELNARINTIKRVMRQVNFSKIEHIFCKRRAFFDNDFATLQHNEQWLMGFLRYENGCTKVKTRKIVLEEPFYEASQNHIVTYGIEVVGDYEVSNNYLRMHGIPTYRVVAGRKRVRKK